MKLEARDTPKASILEAYREDGIRAQCVEVTVKGGKLQKYTLSYGAFRDMHGIVLEPGHAVKMENYSRVIGLPVSRGKEQEEKPKADRETAKVPSVPRGPSRERGDDGDPDDERPQKGGSKRRRGKATALIQNQIRALAPYKTTSEIAKVIGRHFTVVRYHLKKMGIKSVFCARGRKQGTKNGLKAEAKERLRGK